MRPGVRFSVYGIAGGRPTDARRWLVPRIDPLSRFFRLPERDGLFEDPARPYEQGFIPVCDPSGSLGPFVATHRPIYKADELAANDAFEVVYAHA